VLGLFLGPDDDFTNELMAGWPVMFPAQLAERRFRLGLILAERGDRPLKNARAIAWRADPVFQPLNFGT
jgi:hypothetical protein